MGEYSRVLCCKAPCCNPGSHLLSLLTVLIRTVRLQHLYCTLQYYLKEQNAKKRISSSSSCSSPTCSCCSTSNCCCSCSSCSTWTDGSDGCNCWWSCCGLCCWSCSRCWGLKYV